LPRSVGQGEAETRRAVRFDSIAEVGCLSFVERKGKGRERQHFKLALCVLYLAVAKFATHSIRSWRFCVLGLTAPHHAHLVRCSFGLTQTIMLRQVYRRDQPNVQLGRFREFYQCDFDIAGNYGKSDKIRTVLPSAYIFTSVVEKWCSNRCRVYDSGGALRGALRVRLL